MGSEIAQLRGSFCLAASNDAVDVNHPYLAANDPYKEGILTMAFSLALLEQKEKSLRTLVPLLAVEGMTAEQQKALAQKQGASRFLHDVLAKMKAESAGSAS